MRTRAHQAARRSRQPTAHTGRQIRNTGTLGGNIATASPISDLNPLWMALGATFNLAGAGSGARSVAASAFFLAYR